MDWLGTQENLCWLEEEETGKVTLTWQEAGRHLLRGSGAEVLLLNKGWVAHYRTSGSGLSDPKPWLEKQVGGKLGRGAWSLAQQIILIPNLQENEIYICVIKIFPEKKHTDYFVIGNGISMRYLLIHAMAYLVHREMHKYLRYCSDFERKITYSTLHNGSKYSSLTPTSPLNYIETLPTIEPQQKPLQIGLLFISEVMPCSNCLSPN
ncbi:hypothetical protein Celaphus_00006070 [Cervus elaphus hippelaphus]|uniref:Uncharacterized protein n=1 Tax=Cervus elaphus hippelaphus TaxID=46360 RepID=A0A212CTR2_CEREH|nr:hypothetical protein Celaphus_00006070 [Cervus elaphus hippelaphus]